MGKLISKITRKEIARMTPRTGVQPAGGLAAWNRGRLGIGKWQPIVDETLNILPNPGEPEYDETWIEWPGFSSHAEAGACTASVQTFVEKMRKNGKDIPWRITTATREKEDGRWSAYFLKVPRDE